jgi:A/G-specific adenine glycosylase
MTSKKFASTLLRWYNKHGRQNLPWRQNITPYRVWLSEIMLQQTQVTTVISYYQHFLHQFPTLSKLANASEDDVLRLWTGLGYYSRARNLLRTAKIIHKNYDGKFPDNLEALEKLPGIGRSTAGAILAIAMQKPIAILDGNVKRVLTRFHAITGWPGNSKIEGQLWEIAQGYTPKNRADDYTQALMDLGATICTRSKPLCQQCPFHKSCQAYLQDEPTAYPTPNPKKKIMPVKQNHLLIVQDHTGAVLLEKRAPTGIWGGLWSFPEAPIATDIAAWCDSHNYQVTAIERWPDFRHTFSHFHLDVSPIHIQLKQRPSQVMDSDRQVWYKPTTSQPGGLAAPVKKILQKIR